jgi:hypothetical protein
MKKKAIILLGILIISSIFMISAGANYTQTLSENPCQGGMHNPVLQFTQTPRPSGDGTLTVSAIGDYNAQSEWIEVIIEGTSLGQWVPGVQCGGFRTKTYTVTRSQLLQWASDGKIEVTLVQGPSVNCICSTNTNNVTLEYPGANNSLPMNWIIKKFGLGNKDKE